MNILQRGVVNGKPSWRLRWEAKDSGTGERRYVYETFHGPRREAERYWQRRWAEIQAQGAGFVKPQRTPLRDYLDRWLRDYAELHLKPTTAASYRRLIRLYVAPKLGAVPLADLSAPAVQGWLAEMQRSSLSPRTVAYARAVLRAALQEAVRLGLIPSNPVDRVRPPRQAPKQVSAFTPEEVLRLQDAARGHRLEALILTAWQTGLRLGEILALRWEDVDLEGMTIRVGKSLADLGGGRIIVQEPKTERGIRTVAITPQVVTALKAHRARQAEERLAAGERWQDRGLVFCAQNGKPLVPRNVMRAYYTIRDKAGLPRHGFHSLRHTNATLAKLAGIDVTEIATNLGHTSPSFTARTYAHVLPESQRQAAQRFAAFVAARSRRR